MNTELLFEQNSDQLVLQHVNSAVAIKHHNARLVRN